MKKPARDMVAKLTDVSEETERAYNIDSRSTTSVNAPRPLSRITLSSCTNCSTKCLTTGKQYLPSNLREGCIMCNRLNLKKSSNNFLDIAALHIKLDFSSIARQMAAPTESISSLVYIRRFLLKESMVALTETSAAI